MERNDLAWLGQSWRLPLWLWLSLAAMAVSTLHIPVDFGVGLFPMQDRLSLAEGATLLLVASSTPGGASHSRQGHMATAAGAEITAFEPNRRFATKTVTEPPVTVSYDFEVADGGTRLTYTFVMLTRAVKAAKAFAVDYGAKWPKAAAKVIDDLDVLLAFYDSRPSTGSTCAPPTRSSRPSPPSDSASGSRRDRDRGPPVSRWRSSSSSPPSTAGAP
jgi:hypothetical protein